MGIEDRTLRSLEWDKLKAFLSQEAETDGGRALSRALEPAETLAIADVLLNETEEARALIEARSAWALDSLPDLIDVLERLSASAVLSAPELSDLRSAIVLTNTVKRGVSLLAPESFPALRQYLNQLQPADRTLSAINEAIDLQGNVKDDATPQLNSLRKEVRRLDGAIKDELTRIINSSTLAKALQEPIYTQRGGRYVLPVEASKRNVIKGIVHDSSASGLTVYVEPMAVVELANKMRIKESDVEHEIQRILARLSDSAGQELAGIESSYKALVDFDVIFSRARLAIKYGGNKPALVAAPSFEFQEARHPLLVLQRSKGTVVPNDIKMTEDERTLVITGPNTGGKTVLLKTIGLFSIMVRAGFLLPSGQGATAAFFKDIFADIGDEQSLEQSLSTFSSHMTGIVDIVDRAKSGTLVLLDEIGAGTDPLEGAAIARAVLEHLNQSGAVTVATTHLGELKTLAYNQKGFLNGSLAFDDATLSPTYRLRLGTPGSSKGITIARRLGLSQEVVEAALTHLDRDAQDLDQTIERLEKALLAARVSQEAAEAQLALSMAARSEYERKLEEVTTLSEKERALAANELETELREAKELIRSLIRDLQKQPGLARAQSATAELESLRKQLGWLEPPRSGKDAGEKIFMVGEPVRIVSLNQRGTIESVPEDANEDAQATYVVRAGVMKVKVPASDLERIQGSGGESKVRGNRKRASLSGRTHAVEAKSRHLDVFIRTTSNTLDLRGERVEPGLARLERFLDESVVTGTSPLMIIHGHGTGAMKTAVRDYLAAGQYASSFRPGELHEGGDGVTIVQI